MTKVFVAEIVPSENKGEATLMFGIKETVELACGGKVRIYLCSMTPEQDAKEYGKEVMVLDSTGLIPVEGADSRGRMIHFLPKCIKHIAFLVGFKIFGNRIYRVFKDHLWQAYTASDIVLIGHDNAFSKFHLPLILFCLILKKKTVVYGATIMPLVLRSKPSRLFARYLLERIQLITTREKLSYEFIKRILGVKNTNVYCTADKAFILEPSDRHVAQEILTRVGIGKGEKPLLGVMMVRGSTVYKAAFKNETLSEDEKYARHGEEIARAIDAIIDEIGCTAVFVPHCIGPKQEDDDRVVARSVRDLMTRQEEAVIIEEDLKPRDLKALMGTFQLAISERTHGGIASATMQVPTLWISHPNDSRTYGIVGETLRMPDCLYNVENLDGRSLAEKALWLWKNRQDVLERLKRSVEDAKVLALSNAVHLRRHVLI